MFGSQESRTNTSLGTSAYDMRCHLVGQTPPNVRNKGQKQSIRIRRLSEPLIISFLQKSGFN